MIYFVIIAILILSLIGMYLLYDEDGSTVAVVGLMTCVIIAIVTGIVACVMTIDVISNHVGIDGHIAANNERYNAIVSQLESGEFSESPIALKKLYDEAREWNEDLVKNKSNSHDFWIGIFTPAIYDDFQIIPIGDRGGS